MLAARSSFPAARLVAAAGLLAASLTAALTGVATGGESPSDLKARMQSIQAELDATTVRIEELRTEEDSLRARIQHVGDRITLLQKKKRRMMGRVVKAARELYKSGNVSALDVLLSSESFGDLATNVELLSQVNERDQTAFVQFGRTQEELTVLNEELSGARKQLAATHDQLAAESDRLQSLFSSTKQDYDRLVRELAQQRAAAPAPIPVAASAPVVRSTGNMACPVAGPVSFTDTWGAPRSGGRTHQGVDMMANYGTPVVAIVGGSITYSGYGPSAGNWQILSGNDGNQYWYMHNQSNTVTGGGVQVGQQIATVGDTGNARGIPHLHFEYHPGGGGAVNPTPLVASVC